MAPEAKTRSSASPVRSWRTAFLTLRDEIQALPSLPPPRPATVLQLLNHHIFSQWENLIAATQELPPHEVTADVILLMELARNIPDSGSFEELIQSFLQLSHFIHIVSSRVSLTINSKLWALSLDCFKRIVETLGKAQASTANGGVIRATKQCLETLRLLVGKYQRTILLSENMELLYFLHGVITFFQMDSSYSNCSSGNLKLSAYYPSVWEVQKIAFTMVGEVYLRAGTSLTVDIWQSSIEVLRKVMDALASKGLSTEDSVMTAFYYSVLHCLHLVLVDPKGSLSAHVAGFLASLKMFLNYGVSTKNYFLSPEASQRKEIHSTWKNLNLAESSKSNFAPYRPPHLRQKELKNLCLNNKESLSSSEPESSPAYHTSSDSDYSSDGDGSGQDVNNVHCDRTRLAAIICIQDLCRADPKLFTGQWTMLLPCSDVLQPRKYEATLMSCLLFDPYLKARLMSASTIATMLDGAASVSLQVAEFKDSTKHGSFTALSSSLGQILMQLHTGTLYLVKGEKNRGLLASLFKVLVPLLSCTPYSRMPPELLPTVISSVQARIEDGFLPQSDWTGLLASALDCLTVALSVSPPSPKIKDMLLEEVAGGFSEVQNTSGFLTTLFRCCNPVTSPLINSEALQALRAVAHNYPTTILSCWKQVFFIVYGFFSSTPDHPTRLWKHNVGHSGGASWDSVITAAVKVLDECLRAVSGFKGTEDLSDDKFLLGPFMFDCAKTKTISSAPFRGLEDPDTSKEEAEICCLGVEQWSEAIFKHMPCILKHPSGMVRAAAITCFAGLTSPVFFTLRKDDQDFILSSSLSAAVSDDVPSVRSAACRAIGVISCFPQVIHSVEILEKLVSAAVCNTSDSLVSVRITASWALANISDSLRQCVHTPTFENDSKTSSQLMQLLIDNALRLTNDNDKIKANAVRALGNLSRFIQFTSHSDANNDEVDCLTLSIPMVQNLSKVENIGENSISFQPTTSKASIWLGKMVQAFISCVTTGNVKVQWNVCHALSNLFFNRTLNLQNMDWAPSVFSILLLLLRDSANFKIRIQAAAALAVPSRIEDYGRSFYDVLQGVMHKLENLNSDQISMPSNFKYRIALENQMTATMLHVLVLASGTDHRPTQDFLAKAVFLEEWVKGLCSSLEERTIQLESGQKTCVNEKREVVARALQSLIKVLEGSNFNVIVPRFHKLLNGML